MGSSVPTSDGNLDFPNFELSDSGTRLSELELEHIDLNVINELEVEDDMMTDLRVGFKERHLKRLHEDIEVVVPPTKRACSEGV